MACTSCPSCHAPVHHIDDGLVSACPACGLVMDDALIDLHSDAQTRGQTLFGPDEGEWRGVSLRNRSVLDNASATAALPSTSLLLRSSLERRSIRQQQRKRDLDRFIAGIAAQLDLSGIEAEVSRLIQQVLVGNISGRKDRQSPDPKEPTSQKVSQQYALGTAAVFSIGKRYRPELHLIDVCRCANCPPKHVATALASLEKVLRQHSPSFVAYEKPGAYIDGHLDFLWHEASLLPSESQCDETGSPAPNTSIFLERDLMSVRRATVGSPSFRKLVHDLANLCTDKGLLDRVVKSTKAGRTKDMSLCAWAILMHAIEAQIRQPIHEDAFARAAAFAPGRQDSRKSSRFSRDKLNLVRISARADAQLSPEQQQARQTTVASVQSYVKLRYMEIRRMLSTTVAAFPNLVEHTSRKTEERKRSKASAHGKEQQPLSRATIAKHAAEALHMHQMARAQHATATQARVDVGDEDASVKRAEWSRFASSAKRLKKDGLSKGTSLPQQDNHAQTPPALAAMFTRPEDATGRTATVSALGQRLGPTLASLESLASMSEDVVDRLLFSTGELDAIICTSDEVDRKRAVLEAYGVRSPDRISRYDEAKQAAHRKADPNALVEEEESRPKTRLWHGKQTRAMDDEAFAKVLDTL